jgi:Raf kinase inhibitor-like YbhB/YbcL family protein
VIDMPHATSNFLLLVAAAFLVGCQSDTSGGSTTNVVATGGNTLTVRCGAFTEGKPIAERHSGYYDNVSPSLTWSGAPEATSTYAILVEDPDSPGMTPFVHWMAANIPKNVTSVPEALPKDENPQVLEGGIQGKNGMDQIGYFGPKPEAGPKLHHYHFRVFAVDDDLKLIPGFTRDDFLEALRGHVIAQGETVGTFERR